MFYHYCTANEEVEWCNQVALFIACCEVRFCDEIIYNTLTCSYSTYLARSVDLVSAFRNNFAFKLIIYKSEAQPLAFVCWSDIYIYHTPIFSEVANPNLILFAIVAFYFAIGSGSIVWQTCLLRTEVIFAGYINNQVVRVYCIYGNLQNAIFLGNYHFTASHEPAWRNNITLFIHCSIQRIGQTFICQTCTCHNCT